jgi:hypothetical protein
VDYPIVVWANQSESKFSLLQLMLRGAVRGGIRFMTTGLTAYRKVDTTARSCFLRLPVLAGGALFPMGGELDLETGN